MVWTIKISEIAQKQLKKLDKKIGKQILTYLKEKVATQKDPRIFGRPLIGEMSGFWRYRVNDHRFICEIKEKELLILVLTLGHRKNIYK